MFYKIENLFLMETFSEEKSEYIRFFQNIRKRNIHFNEKTSNLRKNGIGGVSAQNTR